MPPGFLLSFACSWFCPGSTELCVAKLEPVWPFCAGTGPSTIDKSEHAGNDVDFCDSPGTLHLARARVGHPLEVSVLWMWHDRRNVTSVNRPRRRHGGAVLKPRHHVCYCLAVPSLSPRLGATCAGKLCSCPGHLCEASWHISGTHTFPCASSGLER